MIEKIHWLGQASFRIDAEKTIYIDPWQLKENLPPADVVLITHEHHDHCSPGDVAKIAGPETAIVANATSADKLKGQESQVLVVRPGDRLSIKGIQLEVVPAYNLNKFFSSGKPLHSKEEGHLGFIVTVEGQRIYHAGDADDIPEMEGFEVDVALLPVSGTYAMTAEEAAKAARRLSPQIVIPMHYGAGIGGTRADAERLAELYDGQVIILEQECYL